METVVLWELLASALLRSSSQLAEKLWEEIYIYKTIICKCFNFL